MKRASKILGITAFVTVMVLITGCQEIPEAGIELGNFGGTGIDNAYYLTEGEWVFSYTSSASDGRWFSVPVINGNYINIRIYKQRDDTMMADVMFDLYYENGRKFTTGPFFGSSNTFTSNTTGKWFVEVKSRYDDAYTGAFAITYTNTSEYPPDPVY